MTKRKRPYRMRVESKDLLHQRFGKSSERQLVQGFLRRLELKPNQIRSGERPDFKLFFAEHKVGLEVTLLYVDAGRRGSKDRQAFETWHGIALSLRKELIDAGLPYIYGSVSFRNSSLLLKVPSQPLISEIVSFCKAHKIKRRDCTTFTDFTGYPTLYTHVVGLHLDGSFPAKGVLWWCTHLQSGTIADALPALIESIEAKDRLSKDYGWQFDQQRWLLIIARALTLADTAVLEQAQIETVKSRVSVTNFDRIYFWDCFSENIWEVFPNPKILLDAGAGRIYVSRLPFAKYRE